MSNSMASWSWFQSLDSKTMYAEFAPGWYWPVPIPYPCCCLYEHGDELAQKRIIPQATYDKIKD